MNGRVRSAEAQRLIEEDGRDKNWKRWGTYLAERQWGTVREDYSPDGDAWRYFPHDLARRRAYRWGEDGLLGWCDTALVTRCIEDLAGHPTEQVPPPGIN
jgi:hypothetical protein